MVRRPLAAWTTTLLLWTGCTGAEVVVPTDIVDIDPDTEAPPLEACVPALTLTPTQAVAEPYGSVRLTADGGTGAYRFRIAEDGSEGAAIDRATGTYAAGSTPDTTDRIVLDDAGCLGEAEAFVDVVPPLSLAPERMSLRPGTTVRLRVEGGSDEVRCSLVSSASGGTVDQDCVYTAGSGTGLDRVRAVDPRTGAESDSLIRVDPDARMRLEGYGHILIPRGTTFVPRTHGGSGELVLEADGGLIVRDGAVVADDIASGTLRVRDVFTGELVETHAEVVRPVAPDLPRDGEATGHGVLIDLGDVNGDGYGDAALALTEAAVEAWYGGAVAVYAGGPDGLQPEPVQLFSGGSAQGTYGRDIAAGDLNGDGRVDLIIGADRADAGQTNVGTVSLHFGQAGGFFAEAPSLRITGDMPFGRLGSAVAACDFDGDGLLDLAVGALDAHDDAAAEPALDQGAIRVWRGAAGGPSTRYDFSIFGVLPAGGGFAPAPGLHLGEHLRAGDLDGDGLCDLAVGAGKASLDGRGEDGVVLVYKGTTRDDLVLTREPTAVIGGPSTSELGRRLAVGDLTGDGAADLLVGAWQADPSGANSGAAYLFSGPDLDGELSVEDALWSVRGEGSGSSVGVSVDLAEVTGDGVLDAIVGAHRWRRIGGAYSEGIAMVFDGASVRRGGDVDDALASASLIAHGAGSYDRFGQAVAGITDADGDGRNDLFVLASRDERYGIDVGAPAFASGRTGATRFLELPGAPSGHGTGRAATFFDVDGDGRDELVFGVPGAGVEAEGANAGRVYAVSLTADGRAGVPVDLALSPPTHTRSDELGQDVASAGDFDGDGYDDLVVVSRRDSEPDDWSGFVDAEACPADRSLTGTAWIYRGGPAGLADTPSFVIPGPEEGGTIDRARPAGDLDGDGYDDLILGSIDWADARGGVLILHGRPAPSTGIEVACDGDLYTGDERFDQLGRAVTALGDLDGDGCDEVAFSAAREESHGDWYNQGIVRILWGHGGPGCPFQPQLTVASMTPRGTELGTGLAGRGDLDGDGIDDLLVGGEAYRIQFGEYGGAWAVPGSHLLELPRTATSPGVLPTTGRFDWEPLMPLDGLEGSPRAVVGTTSGSRFGHEVAHVPDASRRGATMLAVGAPDGDLGGGPRHGGVAVFRWTDLDTGRAGLDTIPWAVLAGESGRDGGEIGGTLVSGRATDGTPLLIVGAPASSAEGVQVGGVYVLRLPRE